MSLHPKLARALASLGLAGLCVAVFHPVCRFGFVGIDDPVHFIRNTGYRGLGAEQLRWMFLEHHGSAGYDPLAWLSFGADYLVWGLSPERFHATNLALYVVCILVFHRVVLRVIARVRGERQADLPSLVAATAATALFAVHPLRVESVAWLSERHGLMAALFALLSVHQYLRLRDRAPAHLAERGPWAAALVFFALALISKSTVLFLPLCLLVLDAAPLGRLTWPPMRSDLHDRLVEKLPFFALSLCVGLFTIEARAQDGMWSDTAQFGLAGRLLQSALGLAYYVTRTFVPSGLSPIQLRAEWQAHHAEAYLAAALAVVLVAGAAFAGRRRWPEWTTGLVLYALLLVPVLGLFQSGPLVVADRYSLLGLAPLFAALAVTFDRVIRRLAGRRAFAFAATAAFALVLAAEAGAARAQLMHWQDADTLWARVFATSADPALMAQNRGALRMQDGDHRGAARDFESALEARPDDTGLLNMAGQNAAVLGDDARALELLGRLVEALPESGGAWRARAQVRARSGDAAGAARDLERYLQLHPEDAEARRELAVLRRRAAAGASRSGEADR